jgi:hypothetical protein
VSRGRDRLGRDRLGRDRLGRDPCRPRMNATMVCPNGNVKNMQTTKPRVRLSWGCGEIYLNGSAASRRLVVDLMKLALVSFGMFVSAYTLVQRI